jgi:hypothetical protein
MCHTVDITRGDQKVEGKILPISDEGTSDRLADFLPKPTLNP